MLGEGRMARRRDEAAAADQQDLLMAYGPAVLYTLDLRGTARLRQISPNIREMVGLEREAVLGDLASLIERIHPEDRIVVRRGIVSAIRRGSWVCDYRMSDAHGRWLWVRDHQLLVRDEHGAIVEVAGVVVDITEQRSFELTLRRDHSQLARLLEMMPVGVVVVDARSRRLLIGRDAVANLVGEDRTDNYAQQLERYGGFWPGTDDELELMDWPLNRTLRTGETVHDVIADVRRADGGRVTVSMSTTPVTDPDGELVAAAMVFLDVTERESILRQTATALAAERDARAVAERARSMVEMLQGLSARFSAVVTRADLTEVLLGPVSAATGAHEMWVGVVGEPDPGAARVIVSSVAGFPAGNTVPLDTPLPGCVAIRSGRPLWIDGGPEAGRAWPAIRAFTDVADDSIAALPLSQGAETFGVLVLRWADPFAPEPELQSMLLALAEVISQAVQRVQLLEHERAVARALQDSMMLPRLPLLADVELAAIYEPAADDLDVGGDWYDVLPMPDGRIGVAVGDVMGRGLRAATTMGQLRSALAALAGSFDDPARVLERLDSFAGRVDGAWLASVFYGVVDPVERTLRYCAAGHVPPLIGSPGGQVSQLTDGRSGLLGAPDGGTRSSAVCDLPQGSTLLLYTDGLVEERGSDIAADCDRLAQRLAVALASGIGSAPDSLADLCDALVQQAPSHSDDVAMLVLRLSAGAQIAPFHGSASGVQELGMLRGQLRAWLAQIGLDEDAQYDVLLAAGEACANSVEHAYGDGDGPVHVLGVVRRGSVELTVSDRGTWLGPPSEDQRGKGLLLMRALVDAVSVRAAGSGTVVTLTRAIV